ncbi:NADPH:quinone reductase-like Zn-dependent oxidoreductase [Natronocella acetinitrilica]|uniref:NADPH:quinone reductase n=1 Tax=Natronocella acetinitrilica TaxID=414046 RepID=A0AAE3KBM6_9GAMM|nr:zinc-binding dehydrogenase [Natronocella acetinitrilica]MCP1674826.1 NADPH:quinone reductase-like Zn-dependent oxidoreductase [Natronocella acetinitrilica]
MGAPFGKRVTVTRSTVINAPIDVVWGLIRDFNGHDRWHPAVASSRIEDNRLPDAVGCVRDFSLQDGGRIREQLLSLSDRNHCFTYCILEAPLPLNGYTSTVTLKPVTDGEQTFWHWEGRFQPPPGLADELVEIVGGQIYEAGFDAIRQLLERRPAARTEPVEPPTPAKLVRTPVSVGAAVSGHESVRGRGMIATTYGGPEVFASEDVTAPPPEQGQVRLRHTVIGLNFIDVYCRSGYFKLAEPPAILGMEAAGVVMDVGAGVRHLRAGDRVAYACPPPGAYCDVRTMDAALVVPLPDAVSDEMAAAAMLKGMSAEFLLHRVHDVQPGEVVLVHAAAGGVGSLLCQWAALKGATVIGTAGTPEKARRAQEFGAQHVIVYTEEDFVARVQALTGGKGASVVYDAVGGDNLGKSYAALAVRGHLVSFGQASGHIDPIDIAEYAGKSATISRPNFAHYASTTADVMSMSDRLFPLLADGRLGVEIGHRFRLEQVAEAHRLLESRGTTGATILLP